LTWPPRSAQKLSAPCPYFFPQLAWPQGQLFSCLPEVWISAHFSEQ